MDVPRAVSEGSEAEWSRPGTLKLIQITVYDSVNIEVDTSVQIAVDVSVQLAVKMSLEKMIFFYETKRTFILISMSINYLC
jgi:hypothetical protein